MNIVHFPNIFCIFWFESRISLKCFQSIPTHTTYLLTRNWQCPQCWKKRPRNWKHTHACGRAWSCVVVRVRVIIPITDIKTHTVNWHRAVLDWFRHKLYDLSKNAVRKFDQFLFDFPRKHGFIYGDNAKLLLKLYTSQCCSLILSVLVRLCMYSCLCSGCNILAYEIQQRIYNDL